MGVQPNDRHEHDPGAQLRHGRDAGPTIATCSIFGEDVGYFGGVFRATEGLQKKYGLQRCFDAPIGESGIVGAAIGMGAYGLRPVIEIQFADYIYPALRPNSSRRRRACAIARRASSPCRSRCARPMAAASSAARRTAKARKPCSPTSAGIKTVIPSNPYDAKGLLISAIEDDDPVIFFEPKRIYNGPFDGHHDEPVQALVETPGERSARRLLQACRSARRRSCAKATTSPSSRTARWCTSRSPRAKTPASTPKSSTCARSCRVDIETIKASIEEDRPLRHRPRSDEDQRLSAPNLPRWFRNTASIISKHPSSASTGWDTPYPHAFEWAVLPGAEARRRGHAPARWRA